MRFEFIVDHLMDLFLQKGSLFLVQHRLLLERFPQSVLSHLEVVLHDEERVLQSILEDLHFFFDQDQLFFGLGIGGTRPTDVLLQVCLDRSWNTIRFLIGSSLIILYNLLYKPNKKEHASINCLCIFYSMKLVLRQSKKAKRMMREMFIKERSYGV